MRGDLIIPVDPQANHGARLCETLKLMLPEILFFQASEEEFNKPILLQRIRGNEFLSEPIVPTHQPKTSAPKDQTTVTAQDLPGPPFGDIRFPVSYSSDLRLTKGYGFSTSSSLDRARREFSTPRRKRSRQSSTSTTVSPCWWSASSTEVSPLRIRTVKATRRLAIHPWMESEVSSAMSTSLVPYWTMSDGWTQLGGEQGTLSQKTEPARRASCDSILSRLMFQSLRRGHALQ